MRWQSIQHGNIIQSYFIASVSLCYFSNLSHWEMIILWIASGLQDIFLSAKNYEFRVKGSTFLSLVKTWGPGFCFIATICQKRSENWSNLSYLRSHVRTQWHGYRIIKEDSEFYVIYSSTTLRTHISAFLQGENVKYTLQVLTIKSSN